MSRRRMVVGSQTATQTRHGSCTSMVRRCPTSSVARSGRGLHECARSLELKHGMARASRPRALPTPHISTRSVESESESESESVAMGPCMSVCESTPDVPKNIIADPEVRPRRRRTRTRTRASRTIIHSHPSNRASIHPRHHSIRRVGVLSNE